jgi:hypothetical protein
MERLEYRMDGRSLYQIRIKGHLDEPLASWFEGFTISNQEEGDAMLTGPIEDQAALHGILNRISNLGLTLISVNSEPEKEQEINPEDDDEQPDLSV